jgi:hypothetical protein
MKNRTRNYRRNIEEVNKGKSYFLASGYSRPIMAIVNFICLIPTSSLNSNPGRSVKPIEYDMK